MPASKKISKPPVWRQHFLLGVLLSAFVLMGMRVVHLQTVEHERLQTQGNARYQRDITVVPARGRILDRNRRVLAVSTPVESLWAEPSVFCAASEQWKPMLALVKLDAARLQANCEAQKNADFMYLKRRLPPMLAKEAMELEIPGVEVRREYKRYYPDGPAGAHLIGFTNVDDIGQEGLENAHQSRLGGTPGKIRALKARGGNYVESVENIRSVRHGEDLVISIDQRLQSLAGDYLERAVRKHDASGGSVVVLAVPSGEILAMVNSPQFNPNDRSTMRAGTFRNRSVTDILEPGSTVKPFTVAMALQSGKVDTATIVDTAPGSYRVGEHTITDLKNYGALSVSDVLIHSSNVGIAKIALAFPHDDLFNTFTDVGFAQPAADLPGEISGVLKRRTHPLEQATLSYGYGLSVTSLQLARAYTVFATDGELLPLTLARKPPGYRAAGTRVFSRKTVYAIRSMLEQAASSAGTASKARVPRYRIGGKTGTVHKLADGRYQEDRYMSVFAGIAPLTAPEFVIVVVVDDPRGNLYYGGDVAAPVFSALMQDLMRLYNIAPDATPRATAASTSTTGGET